MALNEVIRGHSRGRLRILFSVAHVAGQFVYEKGWYGWVQDDVAAGAWGTLIVDNVVEVTNVAATVAMGTKLYAPPTAIATSLPLGAATAGWNPVGRTTATGNATAVRLRQFSDEAY